MKAVVCGGRDQHLTKERELYLLEAVAMHEVTQIVTGGCRGIDKEAEAWAKRGGMSVVTFKAAWDKHGKAAGPIRNTEMAQYADLCIAFPGGRGTADMVAKMRALGKPVEEYK